MSPPTPTSPRLWSGAEVARHCTEDSCWVLRGTGVYDVTGFLRSHPGGHTLILRRAGQDIGREMEGPPHRHSDNARRWMEQYYIGELDAGTCTHRAPQTRRTTDRQKTTEEEKEDEVSPFSRCSAVDFDKDLVDWRKPLAWQVGHLGERYDAWVHQPVDRPIRLFGNSFLEANTKTSWYWVPVFWLPFVFYFSLRCFTNLAQETTRLSLAPGFSVPVHKYVFPLLFALGWFIWSFLEYCFHRFIFHMKPPGHNYYLITLHFLLHGQHHKSPYDGSRLVFPPGLASVIVGCFYVALWPGVLGECVFAGAVFGYVAYDMVHYYLHYGSPSRGSYLYAMKSLHVKHHFEHQRAGFGVTSPLWDYPFNTAIPKETF